MKKQVFLFSILFFFAQLFAQTESLLKPARVIFYNVENLFDTINDPATKDGDFLPNAKNQWDSKKYRVKLNHTAKVFAAMLDTIQPMVIGVCEVENKKVLEDLLAQPALKKFNLGIVHHDSPDERGIDCALLYNKDLIEPVFDAFLTVNFPFESKDKTRDILYFKGFVNEEYALYFFINHWPSRRGGEAESENKRLTAAEVLKAKIENIYLGEPHARVVIMGDFNDNPGDKSLMQLAQATKPDAKDALLINLMQPLKDNGEFTLRYKEQRDIFDQFVVSKNLLDTKSKYFIRNQSAAIYSPEWILFNHPRDGWIPNRTYANGRWTAGYSDHLPVYFDVVFK